MSKQQKIKKYTAESFAPKQQRLISDFLNNKFKFINILVGSVRSGKTVISLFLFMMYVLQTKDENKSYIIVGKTLKSLEKNVLRPMTQYLGHKHVQYNLISKRVDFFGVPIDLEGADNQTAFHKIQGSTYQGALIDELTLIPENFFDMLITRLSEDNAKIIATTNADSPTHWVKTNYLDNEDKQKLLYVSTFTLYDNIFLSQDYIDNLKTLFVGVFYDRYVLSLWVTAQGRIYENVKYSLDTIINPAIINIGLDFGGEKSNHSLTCTAIDFEFNNVYVIQSAITSGSNDINHLILFVDNFVNDIRNIYPTQHINLYYDSAETVLGRTVKNNMEYDRNLTVRTAKKTFIIDRIRATTILLHNNRLKINPKANTLGNALKNAVWSVKEENKRLDDFTTDIDSLDSFEYTIERHIKNLIKGEL